MRWYVACGVVHRPRTYRSRQADLPTKKKPLTQRFESASPYSSDFHFTGFDVRLGLDESN